jgi:hypothetical protein
MRKLVFVLIAFIAAVTLLRAFGTASAQAQESPMPAVSSELSMK